MGCGSYEPGPAAPLGPSELRVLNVQRRAGNLVLATCQAGGLDERMDDLCMVRLANSSEEPVWTPCVRADSVHGVPYVRVLLLSTRTGQMQPENGEKSKKDAESAPYPPKSRGKSARTKKS